MVRPANDGAGKLQESAIRYTEKESINQSIVQIHRRSRR